MGATMRDTLEKNCAFLLRQIWNLGSEPEARRKGFFFEFKTRPFFPSDDGRGATHHCIAVGETVTVPDRRVDESVIRAANEANQKLLDSVIEKFPVLIVTMKNQITDGKPRYLISKRIHRSMQHADK